MNTEDSFGRPLVGQSMIISAFPGTGKTSYVNYGVANYYMPQGFACDSDSSKFDKAKFPENYIDHIKQRISEGYCRIFVSSHKEVREALVLHRLPFVLVYPNIMLRFEYLQRYNARGSSDQFIELMDKNWAVFINDCKAQSGCFHYELQAGQYVANVV